MCGNATEKTEKMKVEDFFDQESKRQDEAGKSIKDPRVFDFDFIPDEVENMIIEEYKNNKPAPRSNILPYFTKVKLRNLTGLVQEF